jgi:hypothetical protein
MKHMFPLPWAKPFRKRCQARMAPAPLDPYYGQCELQPHDGNTDHAMERGMVIVRFQIHSWWEGADAK